MTVEFLDPRGEPTAAIDPYELGIDLTEGGTVGLLANGFPDSENFLDQVEAALRDAAPTVEVKRYNKRDASIVVPDEMTDAIVAECQAVVAAYGH